MRVRHTSIRARVWVARRTRSRLMVRRLLKAGPYVLHPPVKTKGVAEGVGEAVLTVEPGGSLIDRVHCYQPGGDGLAGEDRHPQRIREQARAEASTLLGLVDRQAGDQDHSDRVAGQAADDPRGGV